MIPSDWNALAEAAHGDWELVYHDPLYGTRVWEKDMGDGTSVRRTEYYASQEFMEANKRQRNEGEGKRWEGGKIVASIPMHIWAREIAPRMRDGNDASVKRWLNDPDNVAYRTFKGRV